MRVFLGRSDHGAESGIPAVTDTLFTLPKQADGRRGIGAAVLDALRQLRSDCGAARPTDEQMAAVIEATLAKEGWRPPSKGGRSVRDPIFDTLAVECGISLDEITKPLGRAVAMARAGILSVTPGVTPEEIRRRVDTFRKRYPGTGFTPAAIAKHWAMLGSHRVQRQVALVEEPDGWRDYIRQRYPMKPGETRTLYEEGSWAAVPVWLKQEITAHAQAKG